MLGLAEVPGRIMAELPGLIGVGHRWLIPKLLMELSKGVLGLRPPEVEGRPMPVPAQHEIRPMYTARAAAAPGRDAPVAGRAELGILESFAAPQRNSTSSYPRRESLIDSVTMSTSVSCSPASPSTNCNGQYNVSLPHTQHTKYSSAHTKHSLAHGSWFVCKQTHKP